ncbi:MAG: amidohydrolase family protein, partial [Acidimicrobiales bacterium]
MQFIVYHSAFERETIEGAYSPSSAARGVNSFVKAMIDNGLPPNSNVWADLGTTWRELMRKPNEAAHCVGKLLKHVGEDRVLWGTDAIWYGSPQPQIMAFRAFQITPEFQERFGYPALTDTIKRKIFGLNAAKLFDVDVNATRCALDTDKLATSKLEFASLVDTQRLTAQWQPRGPLSRRDVLAFVRAGGRIGPG